jgi:hypothetical protein
MEPREVAADLPLLRIKVVVASGSGRFFGLWSAAPTRRRWQPTG